VTAPGNRAMKWSTTHKVPSFIRWYFSTPVADICAHMSEQEYDSFRRRVLVNVLSRGFCWGIGISLTVYALYLRIPAIHADIRNFLPILFIVLAYGFLQRMDRSLKIFLTSTEYAKRQGIEVHGLGRLRSFSMNRG
jgi:hypothetical protein